MKADEGEPRLVVERRYDRYSYLRDLTVSFEGRTEEIKLRTPDISPYGMFINTDYLFPEGSTLLIRFCLPITHRQVHARGEVRYSLPGVGVGVRFIEISPEDQRAIDDEIFKAAYSPVADEHLRGS